MPQEAMTGLRMISKASLCLGTYISVKLVFCVISLDSDHEAKNITLPRQMPPAEALT